MPDKIEIVYPSIPGSKLPVNLGGFVVSEFLPYPDFFFDNFNIINP